MTGARLAVLGVGAVGRSVVELAAEYGHTVTAVADSSSAAIAPDGIDTEAVLDRKADEGIVGDADPDAALDADYDVLVEATPTTLGDAEPGFSHVTRALERDNHAVLANKGPVAERYGDLRAAEAASEGQIRFEATVGGAIPICSTIADFGADQSPPPAACSTAPRTSSSHGWPPRGWITITSSRRPKISASPRPTQPSMWRGSTPP